MLGAFAFLPTEVVETTWTEFKMMEGLTLNEAADGKILEYFYETYIGSSTPGNISRPLFAPEFWNCKNRLANNVQRTTNALEAWHLAFFRTIGSSHPTPYTFFDKLWSEQNMQEAALAKLTAGDPAPKPKRKYQQSNARLVNVVAMYDSTAKMEFLRNISASIVLNV